MVTKKEETKIMDYVIKKLIKEERKVEEVIMHSRYIKDLVDELMHLDNLLNEYATKINVKLKGKEWFL